jgi:hypothetical protein
VSALLRARRNVNTSIEEKARSAAALTRYDFVPDSDINSYCIEAGRFVHLCGGKSPRGSAAALRALARRYSADRSRMRMLRNDTTSCSAPWAWRPM